MPFILKRTLNSFINIDDTKLGKETMVNFPVISILTGAWKTHQKCFSSAVIKHWFIFCWKNLNLENSSGLQFFKSNFFRSSLFLVIYVIEVWSHFFYKKPIYKKLGLKFMWKYNTNSLKKGCIYKFLCFNGDISVLYLKILTCFSF